ncbi:MAG: heme lyase CcmF/NrfE family subunit [Gammaproteobacteria bacterium]|nr:heme lyase CcmF/NrfE family subunit [Gammaproteobacteria bacterium]NIR97311.1 heme lyase CcmF/NrfE family subunit [Gammaproteobacteria bacterium]NIT63354.1 heme lyase CcmF/NrfE family subunit [Gammaproteobacteria bacterium]NIV20281.1 heme lyase CcmF/NrfE family subunit [Gammaproteobacteria bacterium]NIX10698.1 heme lyase CcmF/NrfE family subunit [Gammaproteobacteria bacterium]
MIPELGHFALILALCMALIQGVLPLAGSVRGNAAWTAVARPAAWAQLLFMTLAFVALTHAFVVNDFSVAYVAQNSNSRLPLMYRVTAVWGAHEGSLLLWAFFLAAWTGAVALFSRSLPRETVARVLAVMGLVSIGFLLFMLFTSNPFERLFPAPPDGADLNPLLQDPGLVMHPPMLYMGYVGFSVAFGFAIAALLGGRLDAAWVRWSRPWTTAAWVFLTLGITLGSWWAYYELGWGGWWFWDPVENASFMPWLVGTALIHSLAVTEKRGAFKSWTVLLAIFAFSLSLLGTFLVRSGVLTSVHAFATDPARGVFILAFLAAVVGASLGLYAWRAPEVRGGGRFQPLSRETMLLLNNVLLVSATAAILLGTLYPLVVDALNRLEGVDLGKISVGPPYFNLVFAPLMLPMVFLMALAPLVRWKRDELSGLLRAHWHALAAAFVLGILGVVMLTGKASVMAMLGLALAFWVVAAMIQDLRAKVRHKAGWWTGLRALPRAHHGMVLGHVGVAIFIVGVTLSNMASEEQDVALAPGQSAQVGEYVFHFEKLRRFQGPNYQASEGVVRVTRDGREVAVLRPEKRFYEVRRMPMTEAAIDAGLTRDLYVALGEPLSEDGRAWAVRLHHKPFVRWIWGGGLLMALGGVLAASDRRYRRSLRRRAALGARGDAGLKPAG